MPDLRWPHERADDSSLFRPDRLEHHVADPAPVVRTRTGFRVAPLTQVPSGIRMREDGILLVARGAVVQGGIFLAGSLYTQPSVEIHGPVRVGGRAVLGARAVVAGEVVAEADVRVLPEAAVHGPIHAVGDVHLFDGAVVKGSVTSGGDIVVWGGAETGTLRPRGRVRTEAFPRSAPAAGQS